MGGGIGTNTVQSPYPTYDVNNLDSVNELLTNTGNVSTIGTTSIPVQFYLNLQPVRNVYMRSPNISSFNTIGCNGESSIIKKYQCQVIMVTWFFTILHLLMIFQIVAEQHGKH